MPRLVRQEMRRRRIAHAAAAQGGVLGRKQLYGLGVTRWELEAELRAGRWHRRGRQTIEVAVGDRRVADRWRALLEVSPSAVLDGCSALIVAGLTTVAEDAIHVAVPKSARPRRCRGVVVHETRRYDEASVIRSGIPRVAPATAAVHAALWARSDREAALFILAAAQQRLFDAVELGEAINKIRRDRRRRLLRDLYDDASGGVESVGEREFAQKCRARRFPEPTRQLRRRTDSGSWRYDTDWDEFGVSVEIDGSQHLNPAAWMPDALKQNAVALEGRVVLRIPNLALRLDPGPFLDQVEQALRRGGWAGADLRSA